MNSNDFIKKHIEVEDKVYNVALRNKAEKLRKFADYLDMVQIKKLSKLLYILNEIPFIWSGYLNSYIERNNYRYYINKLLAENFIEEFEKEDYIFDFLCDYYGKGNANKTTTYRLTEKGKNFLNLNDIKNFQEQNITQEFKDTIQKDKNGIPQ